MYQKTIITLSLLLLLCILVNCSPKKLTELKHNQITTLPGKITLTGNIPFTNYALTVDTHHYNILLKTTDKKINTIIKQNLEKNVIVTGKINIYDIKSADLKYSFKNYEIIVTDIKLIPNK
tara:strand:+ start:11743 stop:12105 length:363 start_codon:yes stop_codon:yes gene_type:complete